MGQFTLPRLLFSHLKRYSCGVRRLGCRHFTYFALSAVHAVQATAIYPFFLISQRTPPRLLPFICSFLFRSVRCLDYCHLLVHFHFNSVRRLGCCHLPFPLISQCILPTLPRLLCFLSLYLHPWVRRLSTLLDRPTKLELLQVCPPALTIGQIVVLDSKIDQYLQLRIRCFPNERLKPKHHFLCHYPALIEE